MTHRRAVPPPLVIALAGLALVVVVVLVAAAFGHAVVRQAWAGESLPVLNRMIAGRAVHDVGYYLAALDELLRIGAFTAAALVLGLSALCSARVRNTIDRQFGKAPDPGAGPAGAARGPTWRVAALVVLVVLVQGTAVVTQDELWPFSPYAMYSDLVPKPIRVLYVAAITDSGEVRLDPERHLPPFGGARLSVVLDKLVASGDTAVLGRALASLEPLYERARQEQRHALGPLRALRLYRVEFTLDPKLHNIKRPDRTLLLAEHVARR